MKFKSCITVLASIAVLMAAAIGTASASAASTAVLFAASGVGASPSDLAVDSHGNVFTANEDNTISKITPAGGLQASWATPGSTPLNSLVQVIVGPGDAVYTANTTNTGAIFKFAAVDGAIGTTHLLGGYDRPQTFAVAANGDEYYTPGGFNSVIGKFAAVDGALTTITTTYQAGALALDSSGNVYVVDATNSKIWKYNSSLVEVTSYSMTLMAPQVAIDPTSTYLYASSGNAITRVTLATGAVQLNWAVVPGLPSKLTVGGDGTIYAIGYMGIGPTATGNVWTLPSTGGMSTTLATLTFRPFGLAVDSNNNIYLANMMGTDAGVYKITQAAPAPDPKDDSKGTTKDKTGGSSNTVKVGSLTSLKTLLASLAITRPHGAKVSVKTSTRKVCKATKKGVMAIKSGTCRGTVTVKPKKGTATKKPFTLVVTKTGKRLPLALRHR